MSFSIPRIYPITDTQISGLSHAEQVRRLTDGGSRFIQLREKSASSEEFYAYALEALSVASAVGAMVIINDRVDIALAVGAGGVHLGQDDMPAEKARELLGANAVIGVSTHSVEQAINAARLPVDYIAIGPIFSTSTKEDPDLVVGLEGLRLVRGAVGAFPLVAIGGISSDNIVSVISHGADSAAIISDLLRNPEKIAEQYRKLDQMTSNVKHL